VSRQRWRQVLDTGRPRLLTGLEAAATPGGNKPCADNDSVPCAPAGNCSAGGTYEDSSGDGQALVDIKT